MDEPTSKTLSALLDERAEQYPDRPAVLDGDRSLTYSTLRERAHALAGGFKEIGIGRDDSIAILMENRVEWVETMFAAHRVGATVIGVSTWAKPRELEYYLSHSGADAVVATASFAGTDFASMLDDLLDGALTDASAVPGSLDAPAVPELDTAVLLGEELPGAVSFGDLAADTPEAGTDPNDPGDTALVLYTSGSTSKPKGVPLLHGGVVENGYQIGERLHLTPADRVWLASPLFWSYGSANALATLVTHAGSLLLQAPFDPEVALELIREHEPTVYYGMTNMARQIAEADGFDRTDLSFRTGTTIGPPEELEYTMDELDIPLLSNVYGATETYGNCAVVDCTLPLKTRLRTQGRPLPGQDIRIKDPETGEQLEQGDVGEICIGGRITPGYRDNPEKNNEAFDNDGYLHMGDLGRLDTDGRVQFRGRLKNVLKVGGINVSPMEIEERVLELPEIDQAFVVGLDDPQKGTAVGLIVVPEAGATVAEADVVEHCESLSSYKRPEHVVIEDAVSLPETDTGKIKRNDLTQLFEV